jgi:large subunit ribosomal protein L14
MIQMQSLVFASDNSGADLVKCIKVLGGFNKTFGYVGDNILVSIQTVKFTRRVKPGQIYPAVVIRSKKNAIFKDGSLSKFNTNSVVLLTKNNKILGTRLLGPVSKKLRRKKLFRIILMAGRIII